MYNGNNQGQRQMFSGNWTCGTCGGSITELPFEPDPARTGGLKCRDCHKKSAGGFGGGQRDSQAPRQMFSGNWTCGTCGGSITELPFEPDPARVGNLKCRDCHKKSAGGFGGGYRR